MQGCKRTDRRKMEEKKETEVLKKWKKENEERGECMSREIKPKGLTEKTVLNKQQGKKTIGKKTRKK